MRVTKEKKDIVEKSGNHTSLTDVEMKQYLKSGLDEIKFIKNDHNLEKSVAMIDCICIARTMMSSNSSILLHKVSAILVQL